MQTSKNALIIFTRLPLEGKTKTRLETAITKSQCVELHINMLKDLNATSKNVNADIFIAYTPNGENEIVDNIFPLKKGSFPQEGKDIWERMYTSIKGLSNRGYNKVVLIGADIPEIDSEHLNTVFSKLDDYDIAISPTEDKGYCLIGTKVSNDCFKTKIKNIFNMSGFKGEDICQETLRRIELEGLKLYKTRYFLDLDEEEDLIRLISTKRYDKTVCKFTVDYLKSIGY